MKTNAKWQLIVGLIVVAGFFGSAQSAAAGIPAGSLSFTIHVRNYAEIDSKTLTEAEKVASGIFQQAGVASRWVNSTVTSSEDFQQASTNRRSFGLSQIWVNILPRTMSDRMDLPAGVTGLAPGTGPDRVLAYVFYDRVEGIAQREVQRQIAAQTQGNAPWRATEEQILGVVMAHEIGHILLNLEVHTKTGIMRGEWSLCGLRDIAEGYVNFTKQQGEVIQAEVARRAHQQDTLETAGRSEQSLMDEL